MTEYANEILKQGCRVLASALVGLIVSHGSQWGLQAIGITIDPDKLRPALAVMFSGAAGCALHWVEERFKKPLVIPTSTVAGQ